MGTWRNRFEDDKNNLINYLKELGADKVIIKHVNENFKELYDTATIQSAKIAANEIAKKHLLAPVRLFQLELLEEAKRNT